MCRLWKIRLAVQSALGFRSWVGDVTYASGALYVGTGGRSRTPLLSTLVLSLVTRFYRTGRGSVSYFSGKKSLKIKGLELSHSDRQHKGVDQELHPILQVQGAE